MWLESLKNIQTQLRGFLKTSPLIYSYPFSQLLKRDVYFKLETQLPTGSFKVRPAIFGILKHLDAAREFGVITTSSGNFAQAVAWAAQALKVKATIVMTEDTLPLKIEKTKDLGAKVELCGPLFEDRFKLLEEIAARTGAKTLHGFDSLETIQANGTIALEFVDQLKQVSSGTVPNGIDVFIPSSGGGIAAGISETLKAMNLKARCYACQPEAGGALAKSLEAQRRIHVGKVVTLADALVASIPGELTFKMNLENRVQGVQLSEFEIKSAQVRILYEQSLWVEPGAASSLAAALKIHRDLSEPSFAPLVCILTGGNATPPNL